VLVPRSKELELLDLGPEHYTEDEYRDCLFKLDQVGRWLGGDNASWRTLRKQVSSQVKSILDVGCGGGFFTSKLSKAYPDAEVLGIDICKEAILFAQKEHSTSGTRLSYQHQKEKSLGTLKPSFDLIVATLICHHMSDKEFISFIKECLSISSGGILINDLHRHPIASAFYRIFSPLLFRNRLISYDGAISIRRSFIREDLERLLSGAGLCKSDYELRWHFPFRWTVWIPCKK
jgi:2-polyprenyl-3-methyl-5-hydroxy-6-metoxy-1,4-benzoquinol methylase